MIAGFIVGFAIVWVYYCDRERRRGEASMAVRLDSERRRTLRELRVLSIYFTDGPIEQTFYANADEAVRRYKTLAPGDYGGDGRTIIRIELAQPFTNP